MEGCFLKPSRDPHRKRQDLHQLLSRSSHGTRQRRGNFAGGTWRLGSSLGVLGLGEFTGFIWAYMVYMGSCGNIM